MFSFSLLSFLFSGFSFLYLYIVEKSVYFLYISIAFCILEGDTGMVICILVYKIVYWYGGNRYTISYTSIANSIPVAITVD